MMKQTIARIIFAVASIAAVSHGLPEQPHEDETALNDGGSSSLERDLGHYQLQHPERYGSHEANHRPHSGYDKPAPYSSSGAAGNYYPHAKSIVVPCDDNLTPFVAEVLVYFNGDPLLVTRSAIDFLERGFRRVYNVLSHRHCDKKFREVHSATALDQGGGWPVIPTGGLSFALRFLVKGVCRGCAPNSHLFAPPITSYHRRDLQFKGDTNVASILPNREKSDDIEKKQFMRELWQPHIEWGYEWRPPPRKKKPYDPDFQRERGHQVKQDSKGSKSRKGNNGSKTSKTSKTHRSYKKGKSIKSRESPKRGATCTCKSSNPKWRPPTEAEFGVAYNRYILTSADVEGLKAYRQTTKMQVVDHVVEINLAPCAKKTNDFDTLLEIEFTGDYDELTESEIDTLERNIVAVYNGLSAKLCDLLFRDVTGASVVFGESLNRIFTLLFLVDAECRGCNDDTKIFGDNSQRRLAPHFEGSYNDRQWHPKAYDKDCTCPVFERTYSAPTDNAFEASYREAILELVAIGDLPNVDNVIQVTEIDGRAPTSAPAPTFPSSSPTDFPSLAAATQPPSVSPSMTPSEQPTDGGMTSPTTSPTQSVEPTLSPSVSPSMTPSERPADGGMAVPTTSPTLSVEPTLSPSGSPSSQPSSTPSKSPAPSSIEPTTSVAPTSSPSSSPSSQPSSAPSMSPAPSSIMPSISAAPTGSPSSSPSNRPSYTPSKSPAPSSVMPSSSVAPAGSPSNSPSSAPSSIAPTISAMPSIEPSASELPSFSPSHEPTESGMPSGKPSSNSLKPSESSLPSLVPSLSVGPSESLSPSSEAPSLSQLPSESIAPSVSLEPSFEPSLSLEPSISVEPSFLPSESLQPSMSEAPSLSPSVSALPSEKPSTAPSKVPTVDSDITTGGRVRPRRNGPPSLTPSFMPSNPMGRRKRGGSLLRH